MDYLEELLGDQYATEIDKIGNRVFFRERAKEGNRKILIVAHADEVGFLIQSISDQGYLACVPLGSWNPCAVYGMPLMLQGNRGYVNGIIGAPPPHFKSRNQAQRPEEWEGMFIDVGARSADEVRDRLGIEPGALAVPMPLFRRLTSRVLMGKAWDDRIGCALLAETLLCLSQSSCATRIIGAATVQEEMGLRGARSLANHVTADVAIVLEGAPADDYPGASMWGSQGAMGRGVQIRCYDPSMIASRGLREFLIGVAQQEGIPYQLAVRRTGSTDAGVLHISGVGIPSIVLAVPVRYAHNGLGLIDLEDYEAAKRLLCAALPRIDETIVRSFVV